MQGRSDLAASTLLHNDRLLLIDWLIVIQQFADPLSDLAGQLTEEIVGSLFVLLHPLIEIFLKV